MGLLVEVSDEGLEATCGGLMQGSPTNMSRSIAVSSGRIATSMTGTGNMNSQQPAITSRNTEILLSEKTWQLRAEPTSGNIDNCLFDTGC
jgi:hypothetical protein